VLRPAQTTFLRAPALHQEKTHILRSIAPEPKPLSRRLVRASYKVSRMFASGAKTLAATPRQRRNFLHPSTQNAAAGEGLVPAQLSGECLPCFVKCRRPQMSCLSEASSHLQPERT